jgi:hypothetical protein
MVWGKFRKFIEKVKKFGKAVWGRVIKPAFKLIAPMAPAIGSMVGGAFGGPAGAMAGGQIGNMAGGIMNGFANGNSKEAVHILGENIKRGARGKVPAWLANA